jgi:hypothetical protein
MGLDRLIRFCALADLPSAQKDQRRTDEAEFFTQYVARRSRVPEAIPKFLGRNLTG